MRRRLARTKELTSLAKRLNVDILLPSLAGRLVLCSAIAESTDLCSVRLKSAHIQLHQAATTPDCCIPRLVHVQQTQTAGCLLWFCTTCFFDSFAVQGLTGQYAFGSNHPAESSTAEELQGGCSGAHSGRDLARCVLSVCLSVCHCALSLSRVFVICIMSK